MPLARRPWLVSRAGSASGGTLVALAEAARWLTTEEAGLLSTTTELRSGCPGRARRRTRRRPGARARACGTGATSPTTSSPPSSRSASGRTRSRARCCASSSTPSTGSRPVPTGRSRPSSTAGGSSAPSSSTRDATSASTPRRKDVVASGLVWDDTRELLAQKAFLMHEPLGQGHVDRLCRGPELPRLRRGHRAALHERGAAGAGVLTMAEWGRAAFVHPSVSVPSPSTGMTPPRRIGSASRRTRRQGLHPARRVAKGGEQRNGIPPVAWRRAREQRNGVRPRSLHRARKRRGDATNGARPRSPLTSFSATARR